MCAERVRILILEDEEVWRDILTGIVHELGHTPLATGDLQTARKTIKNEEIDIVVTDAFLRPGSVAPAEGLWLLKDVDEIHRKKRKGPLVIVVSGSAELRMDEARQVLNYQAKGILTRLLVKHHAEFEEQMQDALKEAIRTKRERDVAASKMDDLKYSPEDQPWFATAFPDTLEINFGRIEELNKVIDVVLITATDEELRAVMMLVDKYPSYEQILKTTHEAETYYVGLFGEYRAVITKCRKGSIGLGAVTLATEQVQRIWKPRAVIMVGIAFGKDSEKQAIGDVMVASQIISYEPQRIGNEVVHRGPIPPTDSKLLNRFENAPNWNFERPDGRLCKVLTGPILSGEKLVDNLAFKAELFRQYPQAIGGEMEGAGLFAAACRTGTAWILVKSICDWGDGNKHDRHQPLAAAAAASYVHHVLKQETALDSIVIRSP